MSENEARILIIEDEDNERAVLKEIAASTGYQVDDVADGSSALDLIKDNFYDILLVDFQLPDMSGLDLIKQALAISKDSIPIIVTGSASIETAVQGMIMGAHDYMVKPVDPDEIKKSIENILTEREESKNGMAKLEKVLKNIRYTEEKDVEIIIMGPGKNIPSSERASERERPRGIIRSIKELFWPDWPE